MKPLQKSTLSQLCEELAAHPWREAELEELVDPRLGIITGLQEPLRELEKLRLADLGDVPPAQGIRVPEDTS